MNAVDRALERGRGGRVVILTGAGISAESGIPTFRGPEGFWTVGSAVYRPEQLATGAAFRAMPAEVWRWYLWRRSICRSAAPNAAHRAIAELEQALGDRFHLLTQNVDGLHLRAGNSVARTYQIHGNVDFMRCADECGEALHPVSSLFDDFAADQPLSEKDQQLLLCPSCGQKTRPHVLWFDECYDEPLYRFDSSLRAAATADLVLIVGSSGATNLPNQVVRIAAQTGAALIDVNPNPNPFADLAGAVACGAAVRRAACDSVPELCARLQ